MLRASGTVLGPFSPRQAAPSLPSPASSPLAPVGPEAALLSYLITRDNGYWRHRGNSLKAAGKQFLALGNEAEIELSHRHLLHINTG